MKSRSVHLNLLKESEKLSSSPIRLRVMLPLAAMFACLGMLVWWGMIAMQLLLIKSQTATIENEIKAKAAENANVIKMMMNVKELEAETTQLDFYGNARFTWGETLAAVAEVMPVRIQLTSVRLVPPEPQNLLPPRGSKLPPAWGPTVTEETSVLTIAGRTTKETPVISLMESLTDGVFTNTLAICRDPTKGPLSPKVNSFRQDALKSGDEQSLLAFEIEYRTVPRRFTK